MIHPNLLTQEWVDKFRQGDHQAFKLFYDETIRLADWKLREKEWLTTTDREEVTAEGYYQVFDKRKQFLSYDRAIKYLVTAWNHLAIDVLRKGRRWILLNPAILSDEPIADRVEALEEKQQQEARRLLLEEALGKLTPMKRKIIKALFVDGMNKFEVAQLFGVKPQTVINNKTMAIDDLMLHCLGHKVKRTKIHIK